MFNPKQNILDQQLAVSGLEMSIEPLTAISAGLSVAQGIGSIFGASSKSSAEKKQYEAQKKALKAQNEYNKEKFKADKENFLAMREYNFETALTNWRFNQNIQDYQFRQQVRAYNKDQENLANTLKVNDIAARQAFISEQRVMREIAAEQTFAREEQYIENLRSGGKAALSSAGRSGDRAVAMTAADHGRNLAILDASFTSSVAQHNMNMFDIALNKFGADLNARANAMLRPEKLPDIPSPTKPPEPIWVEPMKIQPNFAKPGNATMIQGITGAVGQFGSAATTIAGAIKNKPTKVPE